MTCATYLTDKHSTNVKTSGYGESIGRYEGDTLVVDTIGLDDRTFVDEFGTPHTNQLHLIENCPAYRLSRGRGQLSRGLRLHFIRPPPPRPPDCPKARLRCERLALRLTED
jgi:hypothetical protein